MIATRAELNALLRAPKVLDILSSMSIPPDDQLIALMTDAILEAAGPIDDQPVGERWDAVEWTLVNQLNIHPDGHVGRSPILPLTAWENLLQRVGGPPAGMGRLYPPH